MTSNYLATGGIQHPTEATDVENGQLYSVGDPARDTLIALFSAAINAELGAAWNSARTGTALSASAPVADTSYTAPRRSVLRESGYQFPLLAVYRTGEAPWSWFGLDVRQRRQRWGVDYILGPLKAEDERRLGGALNWVAAVVDQAIEQRGHPAYEDGDVQFYGADIPTVWRPGTLASVSLISSQEGVASFGQDGEGVEFLACSMVLESTEFDGVDCEVAAAFSGLNVSIDITGDGGTLPDAIEIETL